MKEKINYLFISIIIILVLFLFGYSGGTKQKISYPDESQKTTKIILEQDTILKIKKISKKELAQIKEDKNTIRQNQIDEKLYKLEEQRIILDSLLKTTNDTIK